MQRWSTKRLTYLSLLASASAFGSVIWSSCGQHNNLSKPADVVAAEAGLPEKVDYNLHVKPILSDRCFACHGPDKNKQQAGLRLDTPEGAYEALAKSGKTAVVPGDPGGSELAHRILSADPDEVMPTPKSNLTLSADEKALLLRWIEQGAEYKQHWSLVAPTMPEVPNPANDRWSRNDIDRFVLAKLGDKKLTHASEADKLTLLRRVSLDLTGLPPTPADVDAFLADKSPNAYEKVVDRLLKSPHYGERQAMEWLDVARYADTHGYQDDGLRTVWPYRDWVIRSYNANQPFDQFVTWQLAGDLLPRSANINEQRDKWLATAFNRNHQQTQEGGVVDEEYRVEYVADRVNTFGKAFLGLTTECARCHDHKYDPISQKDYFSLYAFFNTNSERGQIPYNGEAAPTVTLLNQQEQAQLAYIRQKLTPLQKQLNPNQPVYQQRFAGWLAQAERTQPKPNETALLAHYTFDEENRGDAEAYDEKRNAENRKKDEERQRLEARAKAAGKTYVPKPEPRQSKTRASVEQDPRNAFLNSVNDTLHAQLGGDVDNLPRSVPGRFGKARFLPGDSYIALPYEMAAFEQNQPFTISSWFKLNKVGSGLTLLGRTTGPMDGQRGYQLDLLGDGRLKLMLSHVWPANALDVESVEKVPVGQWFQVAFTYDGMGKARGLTLYLNGEPMPTRTVTDHLIHSIVWGRHKSHWAQHSFYVGRMHDNFYKDFAVDELRIYNRCLTPIELPRLAGKPDALALALRTPSANRTPEQRAALYTYYVRTQDPGYRATFDSTMVYRAKHFMTLTDANQVMVMREMSQPRRTFLLQRGAYDAPGEEVTAATPHFLPALPGNVPKNRLGLAQWLLGAENPLFSRVMVNRVWQQYFGQGLAKNVDDFGNQGALPSHPELLDYLAVRFRLGDGAAVKPWDLKALHRLIVTSATYRQNSSVSAASREADFDNTYLSRGPSYRLSAEQVRDNALAASGLLTRRIGGPSVRPYQPAGIWEALSTRNAVNYVQSKGDSLYRRSMYTIWKRSSPPPMMLNFDASERHICIVKRQKTSTPLQALVTLNDPQFVEAARVLAQKAGSTAQRSGATGPAIIDQFFKAIISRPARPKELTLMQQLYADELADFQKNPKRAAELLSVGDYPVDKTLPPAQLAAWTVVASTLLNFDEAIIKR
ncbi:protein of unknown function DUF1549 [Fibrella aestuarina BUZ 2]|uniref:Cytochrome c domain-containing protein n=1 Tax=Fibrella aestuarina BUZ 2 TaxID=1166018 RepID=I0KGL1_9BACT|nr:DUF1553 domain-containing protein [Fibrella aestuarina]CCH03264.1 protein of unknown function DUF1549 [Fibrella aestuarina BUZ 2]